MQETLLSLDLPPGFVNNGTKYLAKGRWYSGNLVRWRGKTLQPVGGWVERSIFGDTISGVPRVAHVFVYGGSAGLFAAGEAIIVLGTTGGLYAIGLSGSGQVAVHDITPSAISSENSARTWQIENFGNYVIATDLVADTIYFWDASLSTPAVAAADAAAFGTSGTQTGFATVTTPERFLFVLYRRTVEWPSQEGVTDWTPAATNTAGDYELQTSGDLVCGKIFRGQTLLWTDADLWAATYIGQPLIYSFTKVGDQCGVVSPNAVTVIDTSAYWMGHRGFFTFNGYVEPIPCDVEDYVFGNINTSLLYRVWALANPLFGEVTWFYASSAASDIDSYVTYHYEAGYWTFGSLVRTAGVSRVPTSHVNGPMMFGSDGAVYDHENGNARTGSTASVESGPVELGGGDKVMRIQRIVPDDKTAGDVTASLITSMFPNDSETTNGPYTLASPTSVRLTARQVRLKLTESVAAAWRVGTVRLGVREGGRR